MLVVLAILVLLLALGAVALTLANNAASEKQTRVTLHALASLASDYRAKMNGQDYDTNVAGGAMYQNLPMFWPPGTAGVGTPPDNMTKFCALVYQVPDMQGQVRALGPAIKDATGGWMTVIDGWGNLIDFQVDGVDANGVAVKGPWFRTTAPSKYMTSLEIK